MAQTFEEISSSDFFYRNRDIAGFSNPSRAIFVAIREIVENSLDAAESLKIPPDIFVRLSFESQATKETQVYKLRVEDNGCGIPPRFIPSAFGQILYGSKYKLKQTRGTFGLGGKMSLLYGQITTHQAASVTSSTGETNKIYSFKLMIDIQRNRPIILDRKVMINKDNWRGTIVEFTLEGDYLRSMSKILEYFKQTAMVNPYANLTFIDPKGRLYKFTRATTEMPDPPKETLPHPYGVDVELLQRLIAMTECTTLQEFLKHQFLRVGDITAQKFLVSSGLTLVSCPQHGRLQPTDVNWVDGKARCALCGKETKFAPPKNPKKLNHQEIVRLTQNLKKFKDFLPPDANCLSPLGEDLLKAGVMKELNPEYLVVHQRKPSTYAGHPFVVELGIAYGGGVPKTGGFVLYRFANRIPLLYDEASDVSFRVINSMNWRRYKVSPDMPVAIVVHLCSTKVPYKTVGKEFIADRAEVRREIANALREVARQLGHFLTRKEHVNTEKKRLSVFSKYLPKIAQFSAKLAGQERVPDIDKLLKSVQKYGSE
ncbi:MAG: DNA topoisomerase VI subunit B [Candidatus Bathyarchaeota archaeon]|nr:DNA topoisomerase VI subunit B [Candidatus Bathyarchaeota archaeon]